MFALKPTARKMTHFNIEVVSDVVCPWCFVGKRRLDAAIKEQQSSHPDDTFAITWKPFYLNPKAPRNVDKQAYYESKFGAERTKMMQGHLSRVGRELGIEFAYGGKTGNTRDAHRLIQLGKSKGEDVQTRVVEQLFNSYFELNEDITEPEVLIARGVRAGLDEAETRDWMTTGKGGDPVDREVEGAQRRFISGVPNFTINDKYEVQGADEPAAFLEIFKEVQKRSGGSGQTRSANTC